MFQGSRTQDCLAVSKPGVPASLRVHTSSTTKERTCVHGPYRDKQGKSNTPWLELSERSLETRLPEGQRLASSSTD